MIGAGEDQRHAEHARRFVEAQRRLSAKLGPGRALHRRGVMALAATLRVRDDLPEHARHGLFAQPGEHEVWLRLSNGAAGRFGDARPDVRGFAFKVHGVAGPGALGKPTTVQDFAFINQEVFALPTSDEFADLAIAAGQGPGALLRYLIRRHGFFGALRQAGRLKRSMDRPFAGFAVEPFYSAAPIACGPYAVKVRLWPEAKAGPAEAVAGWQAQLERRLAAGPVRYQLQLQFFVDEQRTPIENPTVPWPEQVAPYVTVADLEIGKEQPQGDAARAFTEKVEAATFDPWAALAEHRPLGEIMRARKVTYYESQKARGVA